MDKKWTSEQEDAINSVGGTVLVSAAAGSGKTAVLVQRIINQITDPENSIDITKFLIVTFTKASAKEMKNRISKKLSEMIIADPKNENLKKQKMLLKYAQIGTIDSFCKTLAEENFYKLGIPPKINIVTESEIEILKNKALEDTLSHFYSLGSSDFEALFDLLAGEKNDSDLIKVIMALHSFLLSLPFPEKWMDETLKLYETKCQNFNIIDSPWAKVIVNYAKDFLDTAQALILEMINISKKNEKINKAYTQALENDLESVKNVNNCFKLCSWDKISKCILSTYFASLKPLKGDDISYEKNIILEKRKYIKENFKKLKNYFVFSETEALENLSALYKILGSLFEIVKLFEKNIFDLKISKNIAEFSDLGRWTLKLLTKENENGEMVKSKLAEEISDRYKEIMIDEYQDINDIQDTIFKMVSKNETNIFAVGDVKQSIYKFRNSNPSIFLGKKDKYKPYDKNTNTYPAKITLGKNFRSKSEIIDVINFIFGFLMSKKAGDIEYAKEEALYPGAEFPKSGDIPAELVIIDSLDQESNETSEANFIAEKILKMISEKYEIFENGKTRPITYGDFCILLRKFKNSADKYKNELIKYGIPVKTESNEKFLETSEILTIHSFLKIINNPVQDVPLIAVMLSPIFNFSIDEISSIRILDKESLFYFSIKKYMESGKDSGLREKLTKFYGILERYRNLSSSMFCNELIDLIYSETDYPLICLATKNGENKKANLMLFSEYAKKFENQYHKGLLGFLNFIESVKSKGGDLPSATTSYEIENSVKIMSIHKSKGLEFPVCILAGCAQTLEEKQNMIYINSKLGVGLKLQNKDGTVRLKNIVTDAISLKNKIESASEELRIFYVALTRAKQKLIMVAGIKNPQKLIQKYLLLLDQTKSIPHQYILTENTMLEWLLMCVSKSNLRNKLCSIIESPEFILNANSHIKLNLDIKFVPSEEGEQTPNKPAENLENQAEIKEESLFNFKNNKETQKILETIKKRTNFKYPEEDLINLPLKVSASQLTQKENWQNYIASSKPCFMHNDNVLSSTDRGNILHKLMYYIDFKNAYKNGIDKELERLKSNNFLNETEINLVNKKSIENFIFGEIGARIIKSPKICREHRFFVTLSSEYLSDFNCFGNHYTVMQGALDCAFLESGKYVIMDYKTDKTPSAKGLWGKYSKQLKLYKFAFEKSQNVEVSELILYSFYLNESYGEKY